MIYAKFISETQIDYPPMNKDGILNYNLDYERLENDGYKIVTYVERPITDRKYEIRYKNNETIDEFIYWLETEEEYAARKLADAKAKKEEENNIKRTNFLNNPIEYKNVLFDSDMEQIQNLDYQERHMGEEETVEWVGFDGISKLTCSKDDIKNISNLIVRKRHYVWSVKNIEIKTLINNAQTVEEVEAIVIEYTMEEILEV